MSIFKKLHKACCEAGGVRKADKVAGMKFNPLLHDSVQSVAMEALLYNGLYPVCTYENQVTDSFIMTTCNMKIHDVENPEDFILIAGTSALGNLDKFGSGNAMSYAKKYAFLNALNLRTGMDNDDGYEAKPFTPTKESQAKASGNTIGTQPRAGDNSINIEDMKREFARAIHLPRLKHLRKTYDPQIQYLLKNSLRDYRQITDIYESRELQLNSQQQVGK